MRCFLSCLLFLAALVDPVWSEEKPEIDFVVALKLTTPPEHQAKYIEATLDSLRGAFGDLAALVTKEPLKDGAATYRLFLEGTVTISFGNSIIEEKGAENATNAGIFQHYYYLALQHSGTLQFKLCKWDGQKYTEVEKWSAPLPITEPRENGRIKVAASQSGKGMVAKCPFTVEQAVANSLERVMPGTFLEVVFAHWLQFTPQRVAPSKGNSPNVPVTNFDVDLTVKNSSPWYLRRFNSSIAYSGQILELGDWMGTPDPIAPGKTLRITQPARLGNKTARPGIIRLELTK